MDVRQQEFIHTLVHCFHVSASAKLSPGTKNDPRINNIALVKDNIKRQNKCK